MVPGEGWAPVESVTLRFSVPVVVRLAPAHVHVARPAQVEDAPIPAGPPALVGPSPSVE